MKNVFLAVVILIAIIVFVGAAFIFLRLQSSEPKQVTTEPQEATTEPVGRPQLEVIESTEEAPQEIEVIEVIEAP